MAQVNNFHGMMTTNKEFFKQACRWKIVHLSIPLLNGGLLFKRLLFVRCFITGVVECRG